MSTHILQLGASDESRPRKAVYCSEFVLLMVVCTAFVLIEGISRGGNIVYAEISDVETLAVGWIFALVTLPLVALYSKAVGASRSEAALLWLILGTVTYTKDFAYAHIPGTPLYVTDTVLGLCVYWNRNRLRTALRVLGNWKSGALALFVAAGLISTFRGVMSGQELMKVARDAELFLYTAFLFLGIVVFRTWISILRGLVMALAGACLSSLNAFAWFIFNPGARRYIPYPMYILAALLAVLILRMRGLKNHARFSLVGLLAIGLVLANARTTYVSFVVCLGLVGVISAVVWRGSFLQILKPVISITVVGIVALILLYQTKAGSDFVDRNAEELISGTVNYQDDPNASFRFLAWLEAFNRFQQNPVVGEGYGVPFVFKLSDADPRPHNTFLTILYKMGMFGFVPFIAFVTMFFVWGCKVLLRKKRSEAAVWLLILLVVEVSFCLFGLLNLMLESPFLASMFWLVAGLASSLMLQMEFRPVAAADQRDSD